ncbi:MAG: hypothetical protein ACP5T0_10435 [Verrucomicrobiia bacterium]
MNLIFGFKNQPPGSMPMIEEKEGMEDSDFIVRPSIELFATVS